MGLKTQPKEDVCENCAVAKLKSKKISKLYISNLATKKGERMMFDIASVKVSSQGGNNYWLLVLDEFTKMKWSFFLKKKSELGATLLHFVESQWKRGNTISIFRCDNSGENHKSQEIIDRSKYHIDFEFNL